jgi:Subtilase family
MKNLLLSLLTFLCVSSAVAQDARYRLSLVSGEIYTPENAAAYFKNPTANALEVVDGKIFRLVQFYQIPTFQQQQEIQKLGVEILDYLPNNAYIFSVKKDFDWSRLATFSIRSILPIESKWKQSRNLLEPPYADFAQHGDELDVVLQWHQNLSRSVVKSLLQNEKISILQDYFPSQNFVYATIKIADIQRVASLPFLWHLDLIPPVGEREDNDSRLLHASNELDDEFTTGLRLNGEGVNVLVRDDGTVGPHIDFKNRTVNVAKGTGSVNHGDQVSGVLGGSGNFDPLKKGIATGSKIFVTDYESTFTDTTIGLHKNHNVMVTNSSYSDNCNRYTTGSQTVDNQLISNKKLMHVFSAGNNNSANCGYGAGTQWGNITGGHKQAKNCVAVANIATNLTINTTSSRGPASDGRIKPDISAHGTNVSATYPFNTYQVNSGTSFSAPATAGVLAIMYQDYRLKNAGKDPDGLLMKSYLLNTATEIGAIGPDFIFGFGNINAKRAVQAIDNQWFDEGDIQQSVISALTKP